MSATASVEAEPWLKGGPPDDFVGGSLPEPNWILGLILPKNLAFSPRRTGQVSPRFDRPGVRADKLAIAMNSKGPGCSLPRRFLRIKSCRKSPPGACFYARVVQMRMPSSFVNLQFDVVSEGV
jgi:hypothetical protein